MDLSGLSCGMQDLCCIMQDLFVEIHITDSLEKLWCWERLKAGGEGDDRGWDSWMASPPHWTWIWASSGSWWWTGKPGVLQSMGSQRDGHDWVTELRFSNCGTRAPDHLGSVGVARRLICSMACESLSSSARDQICIPYISRQIFNQSTTREVPPTGQPPGKSLQVAIPTCIPTNTVGGFSFLHTLSSIYCS